MGVTPVVFDYNQWIAMFPEFSGVTSAAAQEYFNLATVYIRNDGCGPIDDDAVQLSLLYLTTAHIAKLLSTSTNGFPTTGGTEPASPLVGRINTATEGSVSVGAELPGNLPAAAAWWVQTPYGFMVWTMLAPYRTMRYVPARRRIYNPPIWLRGGRPGYW